MEVATAAAGAEAQSLMSEHYVNMRCVSLPIPFVIIIMVLVL
jgi:hypothetical protein